MAAIELHLFTQLPASGRTSPSTPLWQMPALNRRSREVKRVMPVKESDNSVTGIMESQQESHSLFSA
jgi:hypothetical protein